MKRIKKYIIENFSNFIFFYAVLRYRLIIVFALAILSGLLDSFGLTMFLPLLQMADGSSSTDMGNLSFITDGLHSLGIPLTIFKALIILVVVFLLKGLVVYYSGVYRIISQQKLMKEVRMNIVNEFPTYPYKEYVIMDVGRVQNIFMGEIGRLQNTYSSYTLMVQGAIMIAMYLFFSFVVDWQFALLVCVGACISNLIFIKINALTKERSINISTVNNEYIGGLIQFIHQFKYLKATGKILKYRDLVEESIDKTQHENLQISLLTNKVTAFREPMLILIIACVIGIQVYFFGAKISSILISLLFFYRALTGIVSVQANYNMTISNQGAIDNISSFLTQMVSKREVVGKQLFQGVSHNIVLNNVQFNYGETAILNAINLTIKKIRW